MPKYKNLMIEINEEEYVMLSENDEDEENEEFAEEEEKIDLTNSNNFETDNFDFGESQLVISETNLIDSSISQ